MPRKRRRPARRRHRDELTLVQREELLTGLAYDGLGGGFNADDDRRAAAWARQADELVGYWIRPRIEGRWGGDLGSPLPAGPRRRPAAWWRYDAPEPRRRLGGRGEPADESDLWLGVPAAWLSIDPRDPPRYESQATYLERLELLSPDEAMAAAAPATWSPVGPDLRYALDVVDGRQTTSKRVRQACERHLEDLEHAHERGFYFSQRRAAHALRWFDFLRQSIGEWAGEPLVLEPWQQFIVGALFGWLGLDGYRRFRSASVMVARKNGKSTMVGGVGSYLFRADGEAGAQVYAAATEREQAKIVYGEAEAMIDASPTLRTGIRFLQRPPRMRCGRAVMRPLAKGGKKITGFSPSGGLVDEYQDHVDDQIVTLLETGMGARRQPLLFKISTAGDDDLAPAYREWEFLGQVLDGAISGRAADRHFAYLAELDPDDDYRDAAVWVKANPNLGVSLHRDFLEQMVAIAEERPSKRDDVLRYHFCRWRIGQTAPWLDFEKWKGCGVDADEFSLRRELEGEECFAGLDLASVSDLAALVLWFPQRRRALSWFWCPEATLYRKEKRDKVPYPRWREEGYITATAGEIIDFTAIHEQIREIVSRYQVREIAFDEWQAIMLATQLGGEGHQMVAVGHDFKSLSPPSKHLEAMVERGERFHPANPVLDWMARNVHVKRYSGRLAQPTGKSRATQVVGDDEAAIRPVKPPQQSARFKIDGIVALVLALSRSIRNPPKKKSRYADPDAEMFSV